jgi:transposase-like protein
LSTRRDVAAAKAFFRKAIEVVRASLRLLQRDESAFATAPLTLATGSDHTDRVGGGDSGP